ncbi:MAG: hypothetical protein ACEQSX_10825, partial [Baekduiaceae bacterium]
GAPGGVYTGKVRVAGVSAKACKGCRARIVLSQDGLEISGASEIAFGRRSRCSIVDPSTVEFARIRRDGTYRTSRTENEQSPFTLVGRVTPTRVTGRSAVLCEKGDRSVERRLTFTARRTGRVPFDAAATVRCETMGGVLDKVRLLVTVRGVGCGLGHDAARSAPGMRCAVVAGGVLEPGAQRRCVPSGDPIATTAGAMAEITRLADCTTGTLFDSGLHVHATALVGCAEARRVARVHLTCDSEPDAPACADLAAYTCVRDAGLRDLDDDRGLRCAAAGDPRRLLTLVFSSGSSA